MPISITDTKQQIDFIFPRCFIVKYTNMHIKLGYFFPANSKLTDPNIPDRQIDKF